MTSHSIEMAAPNTYNFKFTSLQISLTFLNCSYDFDQVCGRLNDLTRT